MNLEELLKSEAWLNEIQIWIPAWKWLGLALSLFLGLILQKIFSHFLPLIKKSKKILPKIGRMTEIFFKFPIEKPISWILISLLWLIIVKSLALPEAGTKALHLIISLILTLNFIRLAYYAAEMLGLVLSEKVKKTETPLDDQLVPFAVKTLKVIVVILGVLLVLQNNGINVVSLLAGLGLGGLALALAAQDTAANVFGSITILADRPFKVGDYIKIGDTEGNVEEVGFRSTRIRTFYQSLITIPNATVAKEKIDNMGLRPRRRIRHDLGLTYDTPPEKIENFCVALSSYIKQHPKVDNEDYYVRFISMGDFNLIVRLNCFIFADNLEEELLAQQDILLTCLKIAKEQQVEYAFPTQTIYKKNI